jgi:virginiamycin A acetyltransferase
MNGPDPDDVRPVPGLAQPSSLRDQVRHPPIEIGEYTYAEDPEVLHDFERQVLSLSPFIGDRLVIGRY